jgi:hypothetical protein
MSIRLHLRMQTPLVKRLSVTVDSLQSRQHERKLNTINENSQMMQIFYL